MIENTIQPNPLALTYTSHSTPTTSNAIVHVTPSQPNPLDFELIPQFIGWVAQPTYLNLLQPSSIQLDFSSILQ